MEERKLVVNEDGQETQEEGLEFVVIGPEETVWEHMDTDKLCETLLRLRSMMAQIGAQIDEIKAVLIKRAYEEGIERRKRRILVAENQDCVVTQVTRRKFNPKRAREIILELGLPKEVFDTVSEDRWKELTKSGKIPEQYADDAYQTTRYDKVEIQPHVDTSEEGNEDALGED